MLEFGNTERAVIKKADFFILCLQGACIAFNVASISAIVPTIAHDFGISEFIVGKINWAYMLPYGLCALFYGPLTRLFNNKHIAVTSLVLFAVFSFLSGCATSYRVLFVCRFLVGMVAAATTPLVLIYIADRADAATRGKFVGFFFSATFVADLSGLFLSGFVPWRVMFFIPAGLGLIAAYFTYKSFPKTLSGKGVMDTRYFEAFRQPEIVRAFVYIFLISMLYHGVRQWLGVYFASERGMGQMAVSLTLTAGSLAGIFGEAFGGLWSDKHGRVPMLKIGALLMAAAAAFFVFVRVKAFFPVLMLGWGFGWAMSHAGLATLLTDLDKRFIKEVSSLNSAVRFVAGGLGVVVGGWVMQQSFTLGFLIYAFLLFVVYIGTTKMLVRPQG